MLSETLGKEEVTSAYMKTSDGYISFGATYFTQDYPQYFRNIELARYDDNFNLTKSVRHGDTTEFYYTTYGLIRHFNYNYSIGYKLYNNNDTTYSYLLKFDDSLNVIWEKRYLTNEKDFRPFNMLLKNDIIYFSGAYSSPPNYNNVALIACDTSGSVVWQIFFGIPTISERFLYLSPTSDNGFILTTLRHNGGWNYRTQVYKLDSLGNTQWTKLLGGTGGSWALQCVQLPNGNYFCGGAMPHPLAGDYESRAWVNVLSPTGNVIRDTFYIFCSTPACRNTFNFWATPQIDNNSIKVIGNSYNGQAIKYYTKMDFMGNIIWKRAFNKRNADAVIGSQIPLDNGFTFLGGFVFADDTTNTADNWYIIVDDEGCDTANCNLSVPYLEQNSGVLLVYPNPTNGMLHIQMENEKLIMQNDLLVKVFDIAGKEIYTSPLAPLLKERGLKGEVNLSHLQNGIYFLQLSTGEQNFIQKIVIQK